MMIFHFHIRQMNCFSCVAKIEKRLMEEKGVESASVNFASGKGVVTVREGGPTPDRLAKVVTNLGYPITLIDEGDTQEEKENGLWMKIELIGAILLSFPLLLPMFTDLFGFPFSVPPIIQTFLATRVQFGAGYPFYWGAFRILSGDRERVVKEVSSKIGVDGYFSEILPEDKGRVVQDFQNQNQHVGMVGDGVNDAVALTTSDVGFAVIGLMRNNLTNLVIPKKTL